MSEGRFAVVTPECSTVADGRAKHVFAKRAGEFACLNCGQPSDPKDRWQQKSGKRRSGGPRRDRRSEGTAKSSVATRDPVSTTP